MSQFARRARHIGVLTLATAAAAMSLAVVHPVAARAADSDQCTVDGSYPSIGNGANAIDSNLATYVGGDYLAAGDAAESEGLLVVRGNAEFARDGGGVFNVGTVGVGSGIVPSAGSEMLIVGNDLTVAEDVTVSVGAAIPGTTPGGAVTVGGVITEPGGVVDANGGTIDVGVADPLGVYASYQGLIATRAQELAALPAVPAAVSGAQVTLRGDGSADLQAFSIPAGALSAATEIYVENVAPDAAIVVSVDGAIVNFAPNYFAVNGERADSFASAHFGDLASRLLWNFHEAVDVTIGGSSQVLGSILVPSSESATTVTASTNGRILVGGDLTTRGVGNEQHNYPWTGNGGFTCEPVPDDQPTEPEEPGEPGEPEGPQEPSEPQEPTVPEEPSEPATPAETVDQGRGSDAETDASADRAADTGQLPRTGADVNPLVPVGALVVIALGAALLFVARRRA